METDDDISRREMMKPTDEQLRDPQWWDENCESWQTVYCKKAESFGANTNEEDLCGHCVLRPTKPAAPEWDGEGLPPVGCKCEFQTPAAESGWANCLVMGYYDDLVWITAHFKNDDIYNGSHLTMGTSLMKFRPLRTKEQRERDELGALVLQAYKSDPKNAEEAISRIADVILSKYNLEPKP